MSERRSWLARAGLTLLGLWCPGSAHVRLGRFRRAAVLFTASMLLYCGLVFTVPHISDWTFRAYQVLIAAVGAIVIVHVASAIMTWRDSRLVTVPINPWSRWWWVAALPAGMIGMNVLHPDTQESVKTYWIPAQSMQPTLKVGDRIIVQRRHVGVLRRNMIVVFESGGIARVDRIVAVAGERMEVRGGRVVIDGRSADLFRTKDARVFRERLAGERASHLIRDEGYSPGDDYGPVIVPPAHIFVLGDNRDNSADSRFPLAEMGVSMVATDTVIGRAKFVFWSHDHRRIGRSLEE